MTNDNKSREAFEAWVKASGSFTDWSRHGDGYAKPLVDRAWHGWCAAIEFERRRCVDIAATWKSPLKPGTEARLLGHQEAAREIADEIRGSLA